MSRPRHAKQAYPFRLSIVDFRLKAIALPIDDPQSTIDDSIVGMTLIEVMVSLTLAMIVLLAVTSIDVTRVRIHEELRDRSGIATPEHGEASLAALSIEKDIEQADRINIIADGIQVRIPDMTIAGCTGTVPDASCFDAAANYRWDQYRLDADQLLYYRGTQVACPTPTVLAEQIADLSFQYVNEAPAPPGGDPANQDNNLLAYTVKWDNADGLSHEFQGVVSLRASAYTDVSTGLQAPNGTDISPPPTVCS